MNILTNRERQHQGKEFDSQKEFQAIFNQLQMPVLDLSRVMERVAERRKRQEQARQAAEQSRSTASHA